ncbi:predicted protein [Streptomyces sp. AA4]|nr:predicted protein [Streptomyces sp. AA4]
MTLLKRFSGAPNRPGLWNGWTWHAPRAQCTLLKALDHTSSAIGRRDAVSANQAVRDTVGGHNADISRTSAVRQMIAAGNGDD